MGMKSRAVAAVVAIGAMTASAVLATAVPAAAADRSVCANLPNGLFCMGVFDQGYADLTYSKNAGADITLQFSVDYLTCGKTSCGGGTDRESGWHTVGAHQFASWEDPDQIDWGPGTCATGHMTVQGQGTFNTPKACY